MSGKYSLEQLRRRGFECWQILQDSTCELYRDDPCPSEPYDEEVLSCIYIPLDNVVMGATKDVIADGLGATFGEIGFWTRGFL